MDIQPRHFPRILAAALLGVLPLASMAGSQIASGSKSIIVVPPASLPAPTQQQGIALHLYSESGDGNSYLYIEQQQGKRLLVVNITDPAHIKVVGDASLAAPAPFDFVQTLPGSAVLIRFRNNLGMAILDLRKPRMPALAASASLHDSGSAESLGESAIAIMNGTVPFASGTPRDYEIVDTSNPVTPTLLFTARQVSAETARDATGTTFLLGSDGLTIIRRPCEEVKYVLAETYSN